jgi:CHAT domain
LMELSTSLRDEALDSKGFSFSANNLAVGYQCKAARQDAEGARESLQHAVELIQRVIESDERLAESHNAYERSISRTKYIDLLNLGLVCRDLGDRTYSKMMISVKPKESAVFYRRAMRAFVDARDLAEKRRHTTIAATASNTLAALLLSICETFVAERQWAGGDIQAAYYDWLSTLADGPVGTDRLFQTCAVAALRSASSAARAQHTNSALIVECVDTMIAVFSLSQRKLAFDTGLRQDALVAILEVLETLPGRLDEEVSRSQIGDLTALVSLLESLLRVELFTSGCGSLKQLQAARGTFLHTTEHGRLVERAIARPYSRWLDVTAEANGLLVNGLYVGNSDLGLEFRIPSQRRSLELRGIISRHLDCRIQSLSWLEMISGLATAHMEPQLNLEDVPFCIATTRADVWCNGERLTLSACRLPTASWDSWAMTLDRTSSGPVNFAVSFPFLGLYDIASKTLDRALPCRLTTSSQVLLFGNPGVVFELAFPLRTSTETAFGSVTVRGNVNSPEIGLDSASLSLILKTAPHITTGDVAYFVKDEPSAAGAALCSSGVLPSVSPSLSLPSTVLHSFSPLFFFEKEPDRAGLDIINRFGVHEIVLVGIPESRQATDAALEALFDPRRELFLLVDPSELELANSAITRLRGQVYQSLAGRRLLASAASSNGYFEAFSNIQLIAVTRSLAPAASQMLLDLAALRRATIEGRPILEGDRVYRLNVKGNIVGSRRMATLFPLGTTLDTLTERYVDKSSESQRERIVYRHVTDPAMFDLLAGRIAKRPVVIFRPDDETSAALAPLIRHTGALPVPASADGFALLEQLAPEKVYAQRSSQPVPNGSWHLEELPSDSGELALHFQQVVRRDHGTLLGTLETTHPSLVSSRALLEEALPADYAVVSITSARSRPWSYLAANYAAALGSPILLIPQNPPPRPAEELPAALLRGTDLRSLSDRDLERHFLAVERSLQRDQSALSKAGDGSIAALRPVYIGVVCERPDIAIELAGVPPLATRVAIGRLAGPDLISTSILITRAALSENVERTSILEALVMEAADAVPEKALPGARREAEAVFGSLQGARGVHPKLLLKVKRTDFLKGLANAQIVHFAGHGVYRDGDPTHSGLIVTDGIIAVSDLTLPLAGEPLVFSNACESGVLSNQADSGRAWSGLAAAFINAGAVNYLGSLWPISDARSQRLAESFYKDLLGKYATGEALRRARVAAFDRRDSTWAAYVLFGCPRTRLYASE